MRLRSVHDVSTSNCVVALQYRDLPADTYLCLSLYELCEGRPMLLVGASSMPMFSKKGRLKTGQQRLQVCFFCGKCIWYTGCC
jgi:hypothetical protein